MVAIVYKAECVHKMNIICTISSNYLNLVEPKRRFEYLVFVWIQCIICSAECVVIYAPICVYVSGNPRQVTNTQHIARACVLVCWWRTLWSSHYMCYNCRFTIGLSQPIQCVCPHSIHIRSIAQLGSMREKNGMERKKAAAAQHTQRSAVVKHQQCTKRRESARVVSECEPRFMYHSVWRM